MALSRTGSIQIDEREYEQIIKGKIRRELLKYLKTGSIEFREKDGGTASITIDELEIPFWRYGPYPQNLAGIGQGPGKPGTDLGHVLPDEEDGCKNGAGRGHGDRKIVIDLTMEEMGEYFQEVLNLPRIQPKGDRTVWEEVQKYTTVSRKGTPSMRHLRRTILSGLKHAPSPRLLPPNSPRRITIQKNDQWFKSFETVLEPKNNALIIWSRDVSGSMGPEERRVVSYLADLCEFWLMRNYDRLEKAYIIHDDRAEEVSRKRFFTEDWGGGTTCSTALVKGLEIIQDRFPVSLWNIYWFYLSDGFNWDDDNDKFLALLGERVLPIVNQFNYGQVEYNRGLWLHEYSQSGSSVFSLPGTLGNIMAQEFKDAPNISFAKLISGNYESAVEAIKHFFAKESKIKGGVANDG